MNAGPVQTSRTAEPSCDQQPTAPQMVYVWVVGLSSQPACLRHLSCDSNIICLDCAQSSINYMYVKCFYMLQVNYKHSVAVPTLLK